MFSGYNNSGYNNYIYQIKLFSSLFCFKVCVCVCVCVYFTTTAQYSQNLVV